MAVSGKISGDPLATTATGIVMAGVQSAGNVGVPASLFVPSAGPAAPSTMLIANPAGTAYLAATASQVRAFLNLEGAASDLAGMNKLAIDMFNGLAVTIECFGDSTQHGHDSAGVTPPFTVAEPAPARLQLLLRDYFFNNSIATINNGIDGSRLTQMIDGTDGSGSTFAAKMAVSGSQIVYCNHGINDCQNSTPTPPVTYHDYLVQYVSICRAFGKIPVLETPNPIYAVPALGTTDKANRLKAYVQIMKDVAAETGAILVDVYTMVNSFIRSGAYRIQDAVPDGVHPSQVVYQAIGQLLALPIVHPQPGLSEANQFMSMGEGIANQAPANAVTSAEGTRGGLQMISVATVVPKSIKALVRVDDPGLDIYMGYPIWTGGIASAGVNFDEASAGTINQLTAATFGSSIIQEHEVCVGRNVPIGLHVITISANVANSIGLSGIRARRSRVKRDFTLGASPSADIYKDALVRSFSFFSTAIDDTKIFDELPVSRLLATEAIDINLNTTMTKDTAFVIHGVTTGPLTGATTLNGRMGVGVGCNSSGFVTVYQLTGAGTYGTTVLNAVDFSLVKRAWRLIIGQGLSPNLQVFVDGSLVGTVVITVPFLGGFMGAWANAASKTLTIEDLRAITH